MTLKEIRNRISFGRKVNTPENTERKKSKSTSQAKVSGGIALGLFLFGLPLGIDIFVDPHFSNLGLAFTEGAIVGALMVAGSDVAIYTSNLFLERSFRS